MTKKRENLVEIPTEKDIKSMRFAKRLIATSLPVENTLAEDYLRRHRKISAPHIPSSFRFHPALKEPETGQKLPALLVNATNKKGETEAVQAIFLDPQTANKADLAITKRTYGRMRFGATVEVNSGPGKKLIAEGPETGLSLLSAFPNQPIEVALSVSNFKNANITRDQSAVFCCDNDTKDSHSERVVNSIVDHFKSQNCHIEKVQPEEEKTDFNDLLKNGGIEAIHTCFEGVDLGIKTEPKIALKNPQKSTFEDLHF